MTILGEAHNLETESIFKMRDFEAVVVEHLLPDARLQIPATMLFR